MLYVIVAKVRSGGVCLISLSNSCRIVCECCVAAAALKLQLRNPIQPEDVQLCNSGWVHILLVTQERTPKVGVPMKY